MTKIVLTAENFAFGPIGKLLNVANLLQDRGYQMEFAGFGTSLQLAKSFPFNAVHEIDTDDNSSIPKLEKIIAKADLLISSMDIPSVTVAQRLNKTVVWIDCLFWFWDNIPQAVLNVDLFIREKSLKDDKNKLKFGPKIKNLLSVGPIIGRIEKSEKKHQAFISYGGGEATYSYRIGHDTNFPFVMTEILMDTVDWSEFDRIIVATNETTVKELRKRFPKTTFEFICLPSDEFLREISRSEIILITPGLVTSETAFYYGIPTIFLPASNNSQYLQLEEFRKLGLAPASVHMSDFLPRLKLRDFLIEKSTKEVLRQIRELEYSTKLQSKVGNSVNSLVRNRKKWSPEFITEGKKFIDSLGGNGAQVAANEIVKVLGIKK